MPWDNYSSQRYEATFEDVLRAVGPVPPHPDTGPDNPDPFGHNECPYTDYIIALKIAADHGLWFEGDKVGHALKLNRLRELLAQMVTDGDLVGRTRKEWASIGREPPSRAQDILYANPSLVRRWEREANVPRETKEDHEADNP